MRLFIIRHGDPDYVHDTLTERGWLEAELLSQRLLREKIDSIYLSPLGRAQATAKPYLEKSGKTGKTLDFLREFPRGAALPAEDGTLKLHCPWDVDIGTFEKSSDILTDENLWSNHEMYAPDAVFKEVSIVKDGFKGILSENGLDTDNYHFTLNGKFTDEELKTRTIAIFCHMGLGSLLLAQIAHIAPSHFWQEFRFMPTSVSTVLFVPCGKNMYQSKIFSIGDTTHLESIGLTYRG